MRVVILDDDLVIVRALELLLEKDGHDVTGCIDPLDAIQLCEQRYLSGDRFDCIISDWHMQEFDGLEVLEILEAKCPDMRRILLTASPGQPEVKAALKSGLVHHLVEKPWTRSDWKRVLAP